MELGAGLKEILLGQKKGISIKKKDKTDFKINFIDYDEEIGIFFAKGIDKIGKSVIIGSINYPRIEFYKLYKNHNFHENNTNLALGGANGFINNQNYDSFYYHGKCYQDTDGKFFCGTWKEIKNSLNRGRWIMAF